MSALALSSVASADSFTAAQYPATIKGAQSTTHVLAIGGRELTCKKVAFNGTLTSASAQLYLTPEYEECHAIVLGNKLDATVTSTACNYRFTEPAVGIFHLECFYNIITEEFETLEIHVYNGKEVGHLPKNEVCRYELTPEWYWLTNYYNESGNITASTSLKFIHAYRTVGTLVTCGPAAPETTYTGKTLFKGFNSGGTQIAIDVG